ncbi:ABC transporter transmembrane domain-containing protein [Pontibacter sp. G13]|uniref:ABC transporter ATP-binding protein n=1 Tax=Pontibacter sp. G13 TaxID=3074898 RepID=UPI00288AC989|nr:ABC transporter transmembrane domain-containing protein [Pontibacter sp. G13]WNJ20870.1 ABC transporter transmembrane domain-containing protein [Pontibacter sp. G13]
MAKRRSSRGDIDPKDKKKVTKEGLSHALGMFRFILPYKWFFIIGMIFLLLSTSTTLLFPYFLGELVDSAKPSTAVERQMSDLEKRVMLGEDIEAADLEQLLEAEAADTKRANDRLEALRTQIAGGDQPSAEELKQAFEGTSQLAQIPEKDINQTALILVVILAFQGLFSFLRIYLFAQVSEKAMADIRGALYKKLITLPIFFFEQHRVGELTSRLASDVTQLQDMISVSLAEFLRQILTLIVGIVVLVFVISGKLTLFMVATFPIIIIAALIFGRFIRKLSKAAQDRLADSNTIVEETFQSISAVKAFANEPFEIKRYRQSLNAVVQTALKAAGFRGTFVSFIFVALFGGIILVIWKGAHMINSGELEIGQLISFMLYTAFIGGSVAGMGDLYGQLQKTIGASDRLREILGETPEFELAEGEEVPQLKGKVQFDEVQFNYPSRPDIDILQGISLDIEPGSQVALVGHSGAGKSTIAQLILRFYEAQGGAIRVDDAPIGSYELPQLRGNIGIVPQEVVLFGGTIRENIEYGRPGASDADILEASRQANAWEFIDRFPDGLDTIVGDRGVKLSGGQRQRIAIARAILKDPAILILDEATSSLDAESEHLVQGALNTLMEGRTTIIIAHRLSTIRNVDQIYVLENGQIIEAGTHQELANLEAGAYRHLLKLQMEQTA